MPLLTLSQVKSYLKISQSDTSEDDFISSIIIPGVQASIEKYCNRHFDVNTYTAEQHIINHKIFTNEYPIISVDSIVRVGDNLVIPSDSNMYTNYRIFPTYVDLLDWKYVTMGNRLKYANIEQSYVEITYSAGYETIPYDLALAAIKLSALEYKESREERLGVESESEGTLKYTYMKKDIAMPANISTVLDSYKKVRV